MAALSQVLAERAAAAAHQSTNTVRSTQIGSGMRGDKRRTYRFQDNAVTDHVTGRTARCHDVMRGMFDRLWPVTCAAMDSSATAGR